MLIIFQMYCLDKVYFPPICNSSFKRYVYSANYISSALCCFITFTQLYLSFEFGEKLLVFFYSFHVFSVFIESLIPLSYKANPFRIFHCGIFPLCPNLTLHQLCPYHFTIDKAIRIITSFDMGSNNKDDVKNA